MSNTVQAMGLTTLNLQVIRALAQTAESINGWLADGGQEPRLTYPMLMTAHKLSDRIEHIAQYALEGVDESAQRRYLLRDIEFLASFLTDHRGTIRGNRPWTLPSDEEINLMKSAAEA